MRDVIGHLVHLAEATQLSVTGDLVRHGPTPDRMLSWKARELGKQPLPELAARLRAAADGHFRVVGLPPQTVLGEVVVHREDALRPLAVATGVDADEVVPVLDLYRRIGRVAFAADAAYGCDSSRPTPRGSRATVRRSRGGRSTCCSCWRGVRARSTSSPGPASPSCAAGGNWGLW